MTWPSRVELDNLKYRDEQKVAKAKTHFENGGWMDPINIRKVVNDHIQVEGKHRIVAAIRLGEVSAPFSVPINLVGHLHNIITVLNWAIGENSNKAENPKLLDLSVRKIVWLDIKKLNAWIRLKSGFTLRTVPQAKEHWKAGGWMDPSEIRGFAKNGRLLVEGKNRLVAALELGETHAPFSVSLEIADDFLEKYHSIV